MSSEPWGAVYINGARVAAETPLYRHSLAPGEYHVSAQVRSRAFVMPGMSTPPSGDGYAPTYYPGTASPSSAERVIVKPGQDTTGVSFVMVTARMGRLSGRILTSSGEPATLE